MTTWWASIPIRTLKPARILRTHVSNRPRGRKHRLFGVTATAILLFVGSATPLPTRYNPDFGLYGPDKFLHLLGHAGLTAVLIDAFQNNGHSILAAMIAVVLSTGYGVGTELLQEVILGREFERGDVIASFFGSLIGAASMSEMGIR